MKEWRLNEPNVTFWDRLKICSFFLNPKNFWTMNGKVSLFEESMADYVGCKYAVYVSSGSTANTLLAMHLRDNIAKNNIEKDTIVFPSTTWTTSISPFLREGFKPKFIDVNLKDFSIDLDSLENYLKDNHEQVCCVFLTSLIGFVPDMKRLEAISKRFNVKVMLDNCENTFGTYGGKNVSSFFTSTTSTYFGHQIQSVEGGFVFTNCQDEYEYFLMARNHGLTRSLKNSSHVRNKNVDPQFDFFLLGNNFRNTDINAFIGLLDFKRIDKIKNKREKLYEVFLNELKCNMGLSLPSELRGHSPFCLPVLCDTVKQKSLLLKYCKENNIETRPIISGNLLKQSCYSAFADPLSFPNSERLHTHGFYVGLHAHVKKSQVEKLTSHINITLNEK
tara:strand:- start:1931 stop:3100 length:1170 start_codon:yes stop_codon:yes gene_type:complete